MHARTPMLLLVMLCCPLPAGMPPRGSMSGSMQWGAQAQTVTKGSLLDQLGTNPYGTNRGIKLLDAPKPPAAQPPATPAPVSPAPVSPVPVSGPASPREATPPAADSPAGRATRQRRVSESPARTGSGSGVADLTIEFVSGSDRLTPAALRTLDVLGSALIDPKLSGARFRIEGHTDTVGDADSNLALSERRAHAVAVYLEDSFHIPSDRLETVGKGQTDLLVPTPPQTPQARNRRVRIVNLGS